MEISWAPITIMHINCKYCDKEVEGTSDAECIFILTVYFLQSQTTPQSRNSMFIGFCSRQ